MSFIPPNSNNKIHESIINGQLGNVNFGNIDPLQISKTTLALTDWTSWSPTRTVSGGTVPTYTRNDISRYWRIAHTISGFISWNNTIGGTAGSGSNNLVITLPINASVNYTSFSGDSLIGYGHVYENGGTICDVGLVLLSASQFVLTNMATFANISGNDQSSISRYIGAFFQYEID